MIYEKNLGDYCREKHTVYFEPTHVYDNESFQMLTSAYSHLVLFIHRRGDDLVPLYTHKEEKQI